MVTAPHEAMHRFFRDRQEMVDQLFRMLGYDFPDSSAISTLSEDVTEIHPLERRADTVLHVQTKDDRGFIIVFEAQLRPDGDKRDSWQYYVAALRARYKLPVVLVVLCQDRKTVAWASEPIETRTDFWLTSVTYPLVFGPHNVPVPERPIPESGLALAAFAAVTHGKEPGVDAILERLAEALEKTDPETRAEISGLVELGLAKLPAGKKWRELVAFNAELLRSSPAFEEILDEEIAKGEARGEIRGEAKSILRILHHRGVLLTESEQERIRTCTDAAVLDGWLDRALTAASSADLFG